MTPRAAPTGRFLIFHKSIFGLFLGLGFPWILFASDNQGSGDKILGS
ncbi:hypothetical protein SAMN02745716_1248 [Thermoleophilum album]|uniref:Uncharacterized protein n=1 Tax=Thermoleophilum album TaxID=29539 RepID=A0A1H6FTE3_THEAL|nr:hypothetical protein SAMN02745716_1248 [Thermoleophilum album]